VPAPVAKRISVVWLYVRDVARSVTFYNEALGLRLVADPHDPHWAEQTFPDGTRFAVHQAQPDAEVRPGTMNLDFRVDDIDAAVATLRERGVTCGEIDRQPWGSACELKDPDGYRLGLFQPAA
jgi:catechol 2,3-dioxygenase-like lactoylglutathione lyase family enzyme